MLPGYNHNIRYREDVYHVQTEDSGVQNPHIITHLFIGGNIIESRKTSYATLVQAQGRDEAVVEMMQKQHKGMLKDLIGGQLDHKIVDRSKNAATLDGPAPLNVSRGQNQASFGVRAPAAPKQPKPESAPPPTPSTLPSITPSTPPPSAPIPPPAARKPAAPPIAAQAPATPPPAPPAAPANDGGLFGGGAADSFFGTSDEKKQPVIEAATLARAFESKDESVVDSIFGEDLISEKSLDEVILSYLAEDMQKE